ncbi:transporter substrate-binding domain-containing protein [Serratia fonticola]|uniref:transporter substrate-binding domain-containing protein n=1 Tax=Serratia fonticola TaxID=47917 RepID=UPI001AE351EA|nr:transporter substrate-binding domain-containing protein [Serratia fonticola]MBP1036795.1 transporter substrate-binding domain-containing protein [Serratia fonticola]
MIRMLVLLLCSGLMATSYAGQPPVQALQIFSREQPAQLHISLTDQQWRWLGLKRDLRVGTWAPENPPFDMEPESGIYEGIYADYIRMVARNLGLRPQVIRYASRADALQAMMKNEIDTVMDDGGSTLLDGDNYTQSKSFIANRPALVSRESVSSHAHAKDKQITLAIAQGYLSDQQVIQRFPNAIIVRFPSSQSALTCVSLHKCDYFLGNLTTASFLIERNYSNELTITDVYPDIAPGARFLLRHDDQVLQQSIDAVLQTIPDAEHRVISRQWVQRQDIWRFESPLGLTEKEQRWLENNPTVRIVVNPFFAPFTLVDKNGELHGVGADILRLIHLRTGLDFQIITADSVEEMFSDLDTNQGDIIAAASISPEREKLATFTRPWHQTPAVLVVKNTDTAPVTINNNLKLAAVRGNAISEQLSKEWPGIQWVYTDNESLVLQLVDSGKVDGGVSNQLGANFMIDRYFRGKLRIVDRLGENPTLIGFAVRRDEPELLDILNKALADILPQEISLIIHRWQGAPDIPINTWELYDKQFYWVLSITGGLILLVLIWVYARDKETRRRKLVQEELQAQLTFRDTLLNGSPTPIYVLNRELSVLTHNEAFQQYFSQLPTGALRYSLFDLRHPLSALREVLSQALIQPHTAAVAGETQEFTISNGAEERVIAHWATQYVDMQSDVVGLICGWQDITEYKRLLLALSVEKEHAEQVSQAKSSFLATMSHEIRTPISAILGLLELEVRKQPANEAIEVAFESAQTLMGLIGDVLDMAKIESGQLELVPEWVRLNTVITPVIRVFEEVARQKGLELNFDSRTETELEIFVDGGRLRQTIANYLSNAVKFTEQGRIGVRLQSQRTAQDGLVLHIEIEDTGVGISIADQKRLFKPFSQLAEGRKQTGTGLGLVISSQLLEKMHGSMQMRSTPGRGTLILIELPVTARQTQNPVGSAPMLRELRDQPLRALIVDDHPANRMVLNRQLTQLGHQVTEAKSGQEGFDKWRDETPDLIITDCSMPGMDGFMLARQIRATGSHVAIFGLTANAQSDVRERGIAAGMNDCLFKPLRLSQLETALRNVAKTEVVPNLRDLIHLQELTDLLHQDEEMLSRLLLRTCEENEADLAEAWRHSATKDWHALAGCLHKMAGGAQIIFAEEIDEFCSQLEKYCEPPVNEEWIKQQLKQLDSKLGTLHCSIQIWRNH